MIGPGDHRRVAVQVHLDILNVRRGEFEMWVFDVGQEFCFVADFSILLGVDELAATRASRAPESRFTWASFHMCSMTSSLVSWSRL